MLEIVNPATKQLLAELPEDTHETLRAKTQAARAAQPGWWQTPFATRRRAIASWKDRVVQERQRLAKLPTAEMGKPLQQALNELDALSGRVDFFLEHTAALLEDEVVQTGDMEERIGWEPLGVIA